MRFRARNDAWAALLLAGGLLRGQEPAPGKVISAAPTQLEVAPDALPKVPVTNDERTAILLTATRLDLHLTPAESREEARATLTVRNVSGGALRRFPLQISGSLRWESIAASTPAGLRTVAFTQAPVATDTDHTGYAQEAVLTPEEPLAAGASMTVAVLYAGEIRQSAQRLEVLGVPAAGAAAQDWDAIVPTTDAGATAIRGFGNVLWYPVAAATATLGDSNQLVQVEARQRLLGLSATMELRVTVEYTGDPPNGVIFNGELKPLDRVPDTDTELIDATRGVATAEFPAANVGYRAPSLFLTAQTAVTTEDELLAVVTARSEAVQSYGSAAAQVRPLLAQWLGPTPRMPMLLLDHAGNRFEDAGLLALALEPGQSNAHIVPELMTPLTHAWFGPARGEVQRPALWLDQGLPELMGLLWTERTAGRPAALAELGQASALLALAEPDFAAHPDALGEPLPEATAEVYLRLKSASVLWQLRELLGDPVLRACLAAWRHSVSVSPKLEGEAKAFQHALEAVAKQDLAWFFDDWVNRDRGLPDLTIVAATPRASSAQPGKSAGYLVAVEVRNDGDAVADVPVTVRGVTTSQTERLRIAAHASNSVRIVFEDQPQSVQVNDGSVPEVRTTLHTVELKR